MDDGAAAKAVVCGDNVAGGRAGLGDFLHGQSGGQVIRTGPAVFLRHAHAHDAVTEQLVDRLLGIGAGTVRLGGDGLDFMFGEVPHRLSDQFLLSGQLEIHG
ncbi:hypothetical protein SDC9_192437 [bioreactor metagenome]|uniref:Uncharacterized protein n=1 Tax=bioreactor metagenome TaxID=1076179 RepID=A0A645I143_9ZZZZ